MTVVVLVISRGVCRRFRHPTGGWYRYSGVLAAETLFCLPLLLVFHANPCLAQGPKLAPLATPLPTRKRQVLPLTPRTSNSCVNAFTIQMRRESDSEPSPGLTMKHQREGTDQQWYKTRTHRTTSTWIRTAKTRPQKQRIRREKTTTRTTTLSRPNQVSKPPIAVARNMQREQEQRQKPTKAKR